MKIRLATKEDTKYFEQLEENSPEVMFALEPNPTLPKMFFVAENDTGEVVALYAVFNISDQNHSAEMGTFAVKPGGFFLSAKSFIRFMFDVFPFDRLYSYARKSNEAMMKVMKDAESTLGIPMKLEGILRQAHLGPDGYDDIYLFAVLRSEFIEGDPPVSVPPAVQP